MGAYMEFTIEYGFAMIEMFLLFLFLESTLSFKKDKKYRGLVLFLLWSQYPITSLCGIIDEKVTMSLITIVLSLLVSIVFYSGNIYLKIIYPIMYYLILLICESGSIFIMVIIMRSNWDKLMNDQITYFISACLSILFMIIFVILIQKKKIRSKLIGQFYKRETILVFGILLIYTVFAVSAMSNTKWFEKNISLVVVITCIFASVTSLAIILLYNMIARQSQKNMELKMKLQQIESENKFNADMVNVAKRLRALRHDMNNHIGVMKSLLETKQYEDLEGYLKSIYTDIEVVNDFVVVDNKVLSILLNSKKSKAKQERVEFDIIISSVDFSMNDNDMVSLLGNIIDNAVEAAVKVASDKYVMLNIRRMTDKVIIECENTYVEKPTIENDQFITSKKEKDEHGIGLKNIKEIVNKYGGKLIIDVNEFFKLRVEIPSEGHNSKEKMVN